MATRSKNGCITCRIRRVKCDEEKPSCKRCLTSGRSCDGYVAAGERHIPRRQLAAVAKDLSVIGPISRALAQRPSPSSSSSSSIGSSPSPPSEEAIFFDIFRQGTVPSTTSVFPSRVWEGIVLQVAHSEAAVWHAVIAVGSLHQCMQKKGRIPELQRKNLYQKGRWHYDRAQGLSGELIGAEKVLTQKLALIAAANMLDCHGDAQRLIIESLQIVSADHDRAKSLRLLGGSLERMELQAMTFSESSSPYPFPSSSTSLSVNQWLGAGPRFTAVEFSGCLGDDYDDMASELFGIMRALFLLDDGLIIAKVGFGPWQTLIDGFFRRLISWEDRMEALESRHDHQSPSSSSIQTTAAAELSIRLYHATLRTLIAAHVFGSEERWDRLLGNFEYIVLLASLLKDELAGANQGKDMYSVSLEPGFVIPLWMVIHHCRHHVVRHRALKILGEVKRVEGIWRSDATATALAAVVREEEAQGYDMSRYTCDAAGNEWLANRTQGVRNIPWALWSKNEFVVPGCAQWRDVPAIHVALRVKDILGTTELDKGKVHLNLLMSNPQDPTAYGESRLVTVEVEP